MKRRILLASTVTTIVALTIAGTVFAYAAYHGTWSEQPYYGNHWWYKDDPNGSLLTWYADDQWTQSTADSMKYWHTHFPWNEYRIEQEAYNPGAGTSCDRLAIYSYSAMDLPVTGWTSSNGCGSSTYKEELKIEFDENSISANTPTVSMMPETTLPLNLVYNSARERCPCHTKPSFSPVAMVNTRPM